MRLQVASITLQPGHAVLNGTIESPAAGVPGQPFNFPVSSDEVYDRTYEPGKTYDFTLGQTPDTTSTQSDALPAK